MTLIVAVADRNVIIEPGAGVALTVDQVTALKDRIERPATALDEMGTTL